MKERVEVRGSEGKRVKEEEHDKGTRVEGKGRSRTNKKED